MLALLFIYLSNSSPYLCLTIFTLTSTYKLVYHSADLFICKEKTPNSEINHNKNNNNVKFGHENGSANMGCCQGREVGEGQELEQQKILRQIIKLIWYKAQNMQIRLLFLYGVVLAGLIGPTHQVPVLTEEMINDIFKQNKIYMIYVTHTTDIMVESYLNEYCYEGRHCAVLNKMSDKFDDIYNYVGTQQLQYFLIIDAARKLKYVMPIIDGMTVNDLYIFHSKFQQGLLQPYYASQNPERDTYPPCRKVVGKNLDEFLSKEAPIKVLFLYSDRSNFCDACGQILRNYADFAEKTYDEKIIIFGYYHVLKNDHHRIKDEVHPHFLIFTDKLNEEPIEVSGHSLQKLQDKIIELITTNRKVQINPYYPERPVEKQREQQL